MLGTIGQLSHLVAAVAFTMLGLALALRRAPTGVRLAVALAAFITAFWAAGAVIAGHYGLETFPWLSRLETLRTAAWIGVLLILQRRSLGLANSPQQSFAVALALGFLVALQLALDVMFQFGTSALPLNDQHLAHVTHRLGPAKALLDQLSLLLRDGVAFAVCDPVRYRRLAP